MLAMPGMKVVLGLGNPGREYEGTRHNVGFEVVTRLARLAGETTVADRKFRSLVGSVRIGEEKVLLVMPQTFMNLSGEAAREVVGFYKVEPQDVLVVVDDVALDLGRMRIRGAGSSGGHHGLESVLTCLGTDAVPRLRLGVGGGAKRELVGHVLGKFASEERAALEGALSAAVGAVDLWVRDGLTASMNRYNGDPVS